FRRSSPDTGIWTRGFAQLKVRKPANDLHSVDPVPDTGHLGKYGALTILDSGTRLFSRSSKSKLCPLTAKRRLHADVCLAGLSDFALELGYVVENVTGRGAGEHEIEPTPFAQYATDVFPRHAGHRRQIGVADFLVKHNGLRAARLSDEFRHLEQRA